MIDGLIAHWLIADSTVAGLLGSAPLRFYPFGEVPDAAPLPYATWQVVTGTPENTLSCPPAVDRVSVQIDIWATRAPDVRAIYAAIRDVLEGHGQETFFGNDRRSSEPRSYGTTTTFEFWLDR